VAGGWGESVCVELWGWDGVWEPCGLFVWVGCSLFIFVLKGVRFGLDKADIFGVDGRAMRCRRFWIPIAILARIAARRRG